MEKDKDANYWREKCFNDTMSAKKSGWNDAVTFIRAELEKEFGHQPSQRLMAIMDGKKWKAFWERLK